MEAMHAWAKGSKFYEIMEITQVSEGSLIRAIRRLVVSRIEERKHGKMTRGKTETKFELKLLETKTTASVQLLFYSSS